MPKEAARKHLGLPANEHIILFFGFIRKYKGLDLLLEALKIVATKNIASQKAPIKLLIAGEYYEGKDNYQSLIESLGIQDLIYAFTEFIPQDEVQYYLNACDFVIQPYRNATQSGVTPLAYHFEKPMLVTNVGALPDMIEADQSGLVAKPTPESIAAPN
jgi:glycosyltransferase involved in cell wall biosynthesis